MAGDRIRILGFAGSARRDSFNKLLVQVALRGAGQADAEVDFVDLRDYPLPVYDGDSETEHGLPKNVEKLRSHFQSAQGLLIASPEYNGFLSPMLKNTLDWISRSADASPDLSAFQGKTAAVMSASPGPLGGLRGLRGLRELLTNLGITVLPNQLTIRGAFKAFDDQGSFVDDAQAARVEDLGGELARATARLNAGQ
jgi:NAD(P)H-dependent FMN reductase